MDFARALHVLHQDSLELDQLSGTLSILLKYPGDLAKLEERLKIWQTEASRRER
jgi:hypothetical protein